MFRRILNEIIPITVQTITMRLPVSFIIPGCIPMCMDSFAERANNVNLCGGCCNWIDFPKLTIKPAAGVYNGIVI